MKLLIIGGTKFLGRHLTDIAVARGHDVTLFNRGKSNPDIFPTIETINGDRNEDLHLLEGREWDAVIDPSGYLPTSVKKSAQMLAKSVKHYTFISSISVYNDFNQTDIDETAEVSPWEQGTEEVLTGETYGPLKVLCEKVVQDSFPEHSLIIRPGLIVGPHDPTDRFTYWPLRIYEGGEVLAPGNPNANVQFIDVRDLSEWILNMIEEQKSGTYNATGPDRDLKMEEFLNECVDVASEKGIGVNLTWVNEEFLLDNEAGYWIELPLWIPEKEKKAGMLSTNCKKALREGLTFRPLKETIRDTIAWDLERKVVGEKKAGLTREKETHLLKHWQK
ncbi:NAD-dependent epimerase/dehydratase family protein [Evansella tamaricis]|uniref:NAD-dependent epimerase/dehydratase family protein n=1 Tax=Evansella tamaricis TaxID=2069301 RepID=A0ABS6JG08_9BACI|nr:NAD-dependent epimerase/dehydratase family protein [Evansella tamaricis]MBU9711772.1 NAD-dependent epimerase/dehydratase family protein [Evansella tamaricis]